MARRLLLCCGILSSLPYIGMNVFVAMQWESYSSASHTVSELSAVLAFERERFLILGWRAPNQPVPLVTWAFLLQQTETESTRVIVRARADRGYKFRGLPWWIGKPIVGLVHFVMQRRQLLGIANRVESAAANELDQTSRENRSAA
jgi:hypothetical protein